MRAVIIGDIGVSDEVIHVGDEAMFEQFVHQVRQRGATQITAISSHPAETAARYNLDAIDRIMVASATGGTRDGMEQRMELVLGAAAAIATGLPSLLDSDDTALAVIDAISNSDGVAVSGGGNIASTWPVHIFERATIGAIAAIFDKPFVISGQTIGPFLTPQDAEVVADMLAAADLVGLRESDSYDLTLSLGVDAGHLQKTIDDASFLGSDEDAAADTAADAAAPSTVAPYCAVTLANHINGIDRELFLTSMAALLDDIVETTGLEIAFFAHFGSMDTTVSVGDTLVHEEVAARMTSTRKRTEPTTDNIPAAHFARGASLSVSSRYHPAVFAVSGGVPTIGISVDDYTTTKLTGALGNFGQRSVLPITDLVAGTGAGEALVADVWAQRADIRNAGEVIARENRVGSDAWWDRVAGVLKG